MTDSDSNANGLPVLELSRETKSVARRSGRWLRLISQFSLRSLLLLTTLVAVGCWWFLQPETRDELLAGQELKLRRQVRTIRARDRQGQPLNTGKPEEDLWTISDGTYRIVDLHDDLLVDGRMVANRHQGWWTTRHANGQKAAAGKVNKDARIGVWRTWFTDGKLASETSYEPITADNRRKLRSWSLWCGRSFRHGATRAWYPSGALKLEGAYAEDARSGPWKYYDGRGQIAEQGNYVADRRDGEWLIRRASGQVDKVVYLAGLTRDQHEQLLGTLAADLKSPRRVRQLNATRKLEELGPAGVPLLEQSLREGDEGLQLLALRSLVRVDLVSADLMPQIQVLTKHQDPGLSLRAMLAIVAHRKQQGSAVPDLCRRLIADASECSLLPLRIEVLQKVCQLDEERRHEAFPLLVDSLAESLRTAPDLSNLGGSIGGFDPSRAWRVRAIDVEPIVNLEGDLTPHLMRAFSSPKPESRAIVMRLIEEIVERRPPDRDENSNVHYWILSEDFRFLVEQGKADGNDLVRVQAEEVGVEQWWSGGFGGFGGFRGGGVGGAMRGPGAGGGFF